MARLKRKRKPKPKRTPELLRLCNWLHSEADRQFPGQQSFDMDDRGQARKGFYKWMGKALGIPSARCHVAKLNEQELFLLRDRLNYRRQYG